jgi:hypothetical protein
MPEGAHLIQTAHDGVTYNHMLQPGQAATGLSLEVFNASKTPGDAQVAQHMVLLESNGSELAVNETVFFANNGKTTYHDPSGGTFRFYLPPEANGRVKVMCSAPQGMPVERAAEQSGAKGVYKIDFPIKPGETRIQLVYSVTLAEPATFSSKLLHKEGRTRLVAPKGMTLTGTSVESVGTEPSTQATIYEVKAQEYQVKVEGTGTLSSGGESQSGDEEAGPGIQQIMPRVYDRMYMVLGLAALILIFGFVLLYRSGAKTTVVKSGKDSRRG